MTTEATTSPPSARLARGWLGRAAALALLGLLGAGCAKQIAEANLPAIPIPAEPPPAIAAPPPSPAPRPVAPPPVVAVPPPAPPRPVPARPAPLVTTPAPSPAPPVSVPVPVVPSPPASAPATPPPVLSAHVGGEEERRLTHAAQVRIDDTEKIVGRLDQRRLGKPQQETYSTIQSFLVKAKEAISAKDYQRAFTLADKAQILAEQLAQATR